jgi:hypothetical protein
MDKLCQVKSVLQGLHFKRGSIRVKCSMAGQENSDILIQMIV